MGKKSKERERKTERGKQGTEKMGEGKPKSPQAKTMVTGLD